MASRFQADYPWTKSPIVSSGPMRLIALPPLASAVSKASGIGFLGMGDDVTDLENYLSQAKTLTQSINPSNPSVVPVGVGFLLWGADLSATVQTLSRRQDISPCAAWLFAPRNPEDYGVWAVAIRKATDDKTKIWVQITSVADALDAMKYASPDVLVIQGYDAGGHGANNAAGLITLVPEVVDAVDAYCRNNRALTPGYIAAGGISDDRGMKACLALGAHGACLGTAYLAAKEAKITKGYQQAVLSAADGGISTVRSSVYDKLRGTTKWPGGYGGRGVINASYRDAMSGMDWEENEKLYKEAMANGDVGWEGMKARMTTYAGTGVGLVKEVRSAEEITKTVRGDL